MKLMNKFSVSVLSLILLSQAASRVSFADPNYFNEIEIFVGSASSTMSTGKRKDVTIALLGYAMIFDGVADFISDDSAEQAAVKSAEVHSDETIIKGYTELDANGKGVEKSAVSVTLTNALENIQMDALAVTSNAPASAALEEYSRQAKMKPVDVADLITRTTDFGDKRIGAGHLADKITTVPGSEVEKAFSHKLSQQEWKIVTNYLKLRNFQVDRSK
jgi:hypothetical protein